VRWGCLDCGIFISGYTLPQDDLPRVCKGVPRGLPSRDAHNQPLPCEAIMEIVYDERPRNVRQLSA
jgi:hypothetical protein